MKFFLSLILFLIPIISYAESTSYSKFTINEDEVDLVIIHHFLDEKGRVIFDQMVFLVYDETTSRYLVKDWRLIKDGRKVYSAEEIIAKRDEARAKWFEEEKMNRFEQEFHDEICLWNPEFGYSKSIDIDRVAKTITWQDNESLRKVKWRYNIHEITSQEDIELTNRNIFPKDMRSKLRTYHVNDSSQIGGVIQGMFQDLEKIQEF